MRAALLILVGLTFACGASIDGTIDGGVPPGPNNNGNSGSDAGNDAGNYDAGIPIRPSGYVDAWSVNLQCTLGSTGLSAHGSSQSAYFAQSTRVGGPAPEYHYERTTAGACTASVYPTEPYVDDAGYWITTKKSAGTLTFNGAGSTKTLAFNADGGYGQQMSNTPWWNGGESISISASGADVPAFSTTLVAPILATMTSPDLRDTGTPLSVPRSSDLQLTWTGGSGNLVVRVWNQAGTPRVNIECVVPASSHSAVIPASLLAKFPAGPGYQDLLLQDVKLVTAGDWDVNVSVESSPQSQEGCPLSRDLMFQ